MAKIQELKDDNNNQIYPQTHERAVVDSNGVILEKKITEFKTLNAADEVSLYDAVVINQSDYTVASYYITNTGKWNTTVSYKHIMVDVTKAKYLKVTANAGNNAPFWFVTKYGVGYSGQQANVLTNGYHRVPVGESEYIQVPEGAVGAAFTYGSENETYGYANKPSEIVLYFAQTDELHENNETDEYIELPYYLVDKTRIGTSVTVPSSTSVYSVVFPVSQGDLFVADFTWSGGNCSFGFIDMPPVLNHSTQSNWNRSSAQAAHYSVTANTDGYIYICNWESGTTLTSYSARILNRKYKLTEQNPMQLQKSVSDLSNYISPFVPVDLSALTLRTYMLGSDGCMHEDTARHVLVPVEPNGRIFVKKNENRTYESLGWFTDNAVVQAPYEAHLVPGTFRFTENSEDGSIFTVPEGARYCYVMITYSSNDFTPEVFSYSKPIADADPITPETEPAIFKNNPEHIFEPLILAATRNHYKRSTTAGFLTPDTTTLLWMSDVHKDRTDTANFIRWWEKYSDYFDDAIATGDQAQTHFYQSFSWWADLGANNILQVIGNHDAWASESQFNGSDYPGLTFADMVEQQYGSTSFYVIKPTYVYNKYFAPFVSGWGVIQPTGAATNGYCYYYKDYSAIRLIVLDMMHLARGSDWDGESMSSSVQLAWFASVLDDARTNNKPVVVATHMSPAFAIDYTVVPCKYNTSDYVGTSSTTDATKFAYRYVSDFIEAGGEFVCWMVGHTHQDRLYTILTGTANEQFVALLTCASSRNPSSIARGSSGIRVPGTKTDDAFNMITFDTARKLVKIVRVGANINDNFESYTHLIYRYAETTDDWGNTLQKGLVVCE